MCKFILRADDGKYVIKRLFNGQLGLYAGGNQKSEAVVLNCIRDSSDTSKVIFTNDNAYVTLHGTTVVLDQTGAIENRPFEVIWLCCNKIALKGANGLYVSRETEGSDKLHANREVIGPWEVFTMIEVDA